MATKITISYNDLAWQMAYAVQELQGEARHAVLTTIKMLLNDDQEAIDEVKAIAKTIKI